ncbi:MAG: hypothetical protein U9O41_08715 [Candidatus Aerophobetes bacterium]|nr:hypothetical protein [Candidatus Aerophobetes bacterium]
MSYQKLELNKNRVVTTKPKIIMRKRGILWVNSVALEKFFKGAERVYLFWDPENKKVGFQPTNKKKNSFSVSRIRKRNDANIPGLSFFRYYNIDIPAVGTIFTPVWNEKEGLVEIDLKEKERQ